MEWIDWAELFCAAASFALAFIVAVVQYHQSKRMEKFERRQDERDERRHAEGNRTQAVEFISKYYSDRGLIPLCAIAAMHNDLFYYSREMYRSFCCLVPEVQNLILEYSNLDLRVRKEIDLFDRCIAAVEDALLDRFPDDEAVLYDDGKYVIQSLNRYAREKLPTGRINCLTECLNAFSLSYDGYTPEYERPIIDVLRKAFESQDASLTPISALEKAYCFKTSSEIKACRFATTVALCTAIVSPGNETEEKDYGCPGGFDDERLETMEDLFLFCRLSDVYQASTSERGIGIATACPSFKYAFNLIRLISDLSRTH